MSKQTTLSKSDESKLQRYLTDIDKAKSDMVHGAVAIGDALMAAREILDKPADFVPWVESNCGFSKSTAYRYIEVTQAFGGFAKIEYFQVSALYVLVKNEEAAKKAKALASRGKRITHEMAKEIVKEVEAAAREVETEEPEFHSQVGNGAAEVIDVKALPVSEISDSEPEEVATEPVSVATETQPGAPAAPAEEPAPEELPAGGYEPEEAKKPLKTLTESLAKAARAHADVKLILGGSEDLQAVYTHIDQATIALTKFRAKFSKRAR